MTYAIHYQCKGIEVWNIGFEVKHYKSIQSLYNRLKAYSVHNGDFNRAIIEVLEYNQEPKYIEAIKLAPRCFRYQEHSEVTE
jgi:hypothetical protein